MEEFDSDSSDSDSDSSSRDNDSDSSSRDSCPDTTNSETKSTDVADISSCKLNDSENVPVDLKDCNQRDVKRANESTSQKIWDQFINELCKDIANMCDGPSRLTPEQLVEKQRLLVYDRRSWTWYTGFIRKVVTSKSYMVALDGDEVKNRKFSEDKLLRHGFVESKPRTTELREGTRVFAYQRALQRLFSGFVVKAPFSKAEPSFPCSEPSVFVIFDDGDSDQIPIEQIWLIPRDALPVTEGDARIKFLLKENEKRQNNEKRKKKKRKEEKPLCILTTKRCKYMIYENDIKRLFQEKWLNDSLIDFYLNSLTDSHNTAQLETQRGKNFGVFDCLWYKSLEKNLIKAPRRCKAQYNVFSKDFLLIPINYGNHWILAIVCFLPAIKKIIHSARNLPSQRNVINEKSMTSSQWNEVAFMLYFDSMPYPVVKKEAISRIFVNLRKYLLFEYRQCYRYPRSLKFNESNLPGYIIPVPKQMNTSDCGCFVLLFASHFFKDNEKLFLHTHVPDLRQWFKPETSSVRLSIINVFYEKILKYWLDVGDDESIDEKSESDSDIEIIEEV